VGMKAGMFCSFPGISLYEGSLAVGGTLSRLRLRRSLFACLSLSVRFLLRFFPETSTSGASMSLPVEGNLMKGVEVGPDLVGRSRWVGRIVGGRVLVLEGDSNFCPGMSGVSTSESSSNAGIGPKSAGGTESKSARDSTDALGSSGRGKGEVLVGDKNGDDGKLYVATEGEGGRLLMGSGGDDASDDASVFGEGICEGQIVMQSLHLAQYASSLNIASPSAVDMERDVTNPPARGANWENSRPERV
jgi:hypothetical protein